MASIFDVTQQRYIMPSTNTTSYVHNHRNLIQQCLHYKKVEPMRGTLDFRTGGGEHETGITNDITCNPPACQVSEWDVKHTFC